MPAVYYRSWADPISISRAVVRVMNAKNKIKLKDVSSAGNISIDRKCSRCKKSICCNSINQPIPTPRTREDFEHLIWQVSHENINIFKDIEGWFLHVDTNCMHLQPGGICGIYEKRPWVCREYSNDFCEYDETIPEASEYFFTTSEQLEKYCRKRFKQWDRRFELYE